MLRLKSRFSSLVGRLSPKSIEGEFRTDLFILWENAAAKSDSVALLAGFKTKEYQSGF
jgi:hypothetical protein